MNELATVLTDYALAHGLVVRPTDTQVAENKGNALASHAPVTLRPSPFPRQAFEQAYRLQRNFNRLYASIASDPEFLDSIVETLSGVDPFTNELWQLYKEVRGAGTKHEYSLGLFRSDYMLHGDQLRQVEFNTISASFGGLGAKTAACHRYLYDLGLYEDAYIRKEALVPTSAIQGLAAGIAAAHRVYRASTHVAVVLFIVQESERNAFDQRWIEYDLMET